MTKIPIETLTLDQITRLAPPDYWDTAAPVLMCATDDRYIMPLAASLVSVAKNAGQMLSPADTQNNDSSEQRTLQLVLLDGGIEDANWERFESLLQEYNITTLRIQAEQSAVEHLNISHHISHTAYFRLLSSQWLPDWIHRVIYLDCDTIVLGNIFELWELSLADRSGNEVWAVPDIACPFIDAKIACPEFSKFGPLLAAITPIPNYRELEIDGKGLYFNSGVMVLDLNAWRKHDRSNELLDCLIDNQPHVWCWDQYALNVVFSQHWGKLPLAWNFGAHAFDFPRDGQGGRQAPLMQEQFHQMMIQPGVVHFTTEIKPWHFYCFHPLKHLFFRYLDQTPWSTWRPEPAGLRAWWHVQNFRLQKTIMAGGRRWGWLDN